MRVDARGALALVACVGVLALCLDHLGGLLLLAVAASAPMFGAPAAAGWRGRFVGLAFLVAWTTAFSQGLFYTGQPRTPVHVGPIVFWREGVLHGLVQSLRFVAVVGAGISLTTRRSPAALVAALVRMGVPFPAALMGITALRGVPTVAAEAMAVRRARTRRRLGLTLSPLRLATEEAALLVPVAARAIRRARTLAESLDARGYSPDALRTEVELSRPGALQSAGVAAVVAVTAAVAASRVLFALYGAELVYLPAARPLYAIVRGWL